MLKFAFWTSPVWFIVRGSHLFSYVTRASGFCVVFRNSTKKGLIVETAYLGSLGSTDSRLLTNILAYHDLWLIVSNHVKYSNPHNTHTHTMMYAEFQCCNPIQSCLYDCNVSSCSQFVFVYNFQECKQVENDSPYYDFHYNTRRARPSIVHFQV